MKNVAVFFHPFKQFNQLSINKWEASHFLIRYRIYHDGSYITTHTGKQRRHLGVSPNSPHFIAMAEALADPCFDRFDSPHITISLISMHNAVHQRIQRHLLGHSEPSSSGDSSYNKIAASALQFVDRSRTVSLCADKGSSLRRNLPNGDVFNKEPGIVADEKVKASIAADIEFCCNRAVDRHREHLLRIAEFNKEPDTYMGNDYGLPF